MKVLPTVPNWRCVLDRARLFADDGMVRAEHLPEWLSAGAPPRVMHAVHALNAEPAALQAPIALHAAPGRRGELEDATLRQLSESSGATCKELAQQLGLSERTLYRRLKALGVG